MLNASGIANCMLCGEPIISQKEINDNYDSDLEIHGDVKVCPSCNLNYWCGCCKNYSMCKKYKITEWVSSYCNNITRYICMKCSKEYFYYGDDKTLIFVHMNNFPAWRRNNPDVHYERVGGNIEQLIDKDSVINAVQAA